ncbi:MAG: hypothetical protein ABFS46_01285 [Myxococcota bacterium]
MEGAQEVLAKEYPAKEATQDPAAVCGIPDRFLSHMAGPPDVRIIASKRVVAVGEPFDIVVIGHSPIGLKAIWWFGQGTGNVDHDKAHWHALTGENAAEQAWTGLSLGQPGTYTFGANARDTLYGVQLGVPHQASEGAGIDTCFVEVRTDTSYDAQVDLIKGQTGRSDAWEQWMKSAQIRPRYEPVWNRSHTSPTTIRGAFRYGGAPVAYSPPWPSEDDHMAALEQLGELTFPPIGFWTVFNGDAAVSDVVVEVRGGGTTSQAFLNESPRRVYLYYEAIFGHEFGHVLDVPHHYIGSDVSNPVHLPPGETKCVMARNASMYCSGCRTAMHLDQYVDNSAAVGGISSDINSRYP